MSAGRRLPTLLLPLAAPTAAVVALLLGFDPVAAEGKAALITRDGGYVGSNACVDCHADRHASWARTFHRTMTQEPTDGAVLGVFAGRMVAWEGGFARPWERDGVRYVDVVRDPGGGRTAEVALLAGSRRYQQLFERVRRPGGAAFVRLPIVWSVVEARWLPLHAVFLEPDGADPLRHAADWNSNCVFCHTTAPSPRLVAGRDAVATGGAAFESKAAELGIACEACHGPGAAHAEAMRDPLARLAPGRGADLGIVDPARLPPTESVAVCGQCHGQRLPDPPERAEEWITRGPTFRPGDDLLRHVRPVERTTPPPAGAAPDLFTRRFWGDGTPRLTAYEFQGLVASPCHVRGGLTCVRCHAMHDGDPRGQLRPGSEGDRACAACHEPARYATTTHTGHSEGGPGASCVACHLPRIVYGVLDQHRSHRIDSPDPRRDGESGRPHACSLCHLDRSLAWSATEMSRIWGRTFAPPAFRHDRAPLNGPDGLLSLLAGDPVARSVFARAAGDAPLAVADRGGPEPEAVGFRARRLRFDLARRAALGFTLGDAYPSVRITALRALKALDADVAPLFHRRVGAFDPMDEPSRRRAAILGALDRLRADATTDFFDVFPKDGLPPFGWDENGRVDADRLVSLANLQDDSGVSIGE